MEEMAVKTDKLQALTDLENQRDAMLAYLKVHKHFIYMEFLFVMSALFEAIRM
jgi:hypothetical protein